MSRRARTLSTLLGVILLACAAVVYLDQQGRFNADTPGTSGSLPSTTDLPLSPDTTAPPAAPQEPEGGYGELQ